MDSNRLKQNLIASGLAGPGNIVGCSSEEIAALERQYGPLPRSYRAVLRTIGHGAGRLAEQAECEFYYDQLAQINAGARWALEAWAEDGHDPEVPEAAFFIGARNGEMPWFVLAEGGTDCPVWLLDSHTGRVRQAQASVWDWIGGFISPGRA
ncbi:SMI1/KNR4 family protein [Pelagibacterium xiamenense]|uniref:SMI1/KNR4 family protein n=1 Tax=Pelagibacterium xiamenense TaxID=2901140 RepID=UPI001E3B2BE0|nr:SMI1/KNR4 family protein [Pelagibacterium xiamenense]MCD7059918.1 SMI1/KNR4 family protein [Pelagibacterium xiamenense]